MNEKQIMEPQKCADSKPVSLSEERKFAVLIAATILGGWPTLDLLRILGGPSFMRFVQKGRGCRLP